MSSTTDRVDRAIELTGERDGRYGLEPLPDLSPHHRRIYDEAYERGAANPVDVTKD